MPETTDDEILRNLTLETQEMIQFLKANGTAKFPESAQTGMLRMSVIALIADLQLRGVLPSNFHIANGAVIRHL